MTPQGDTPMTIDSATIVEFLKERVDIWGLVITLKDFEGLEHILSGHPIWPEIKTGGRKVFVEARKQQEQQELARAKANATDVYQIMPAAETGINMSGLHFDGAMYDVNNNDKVTIGGETDEQEQN